MKHISGAEEFGCVFDVSRETLDALTEYAELLHHWNARINLVSRRTLPDLWHRHMADSAQLWNLRPAQANSWLDLGSGAGFPGLVLATMATREPCQLFGLVEADHRKAAFLQAVARALKLRVIVHTDRIEAMAPARADVVTARALAPLSRLLLYTEKIRSPLGVALFLKGEAVQDELAEARAKWDFDYKLHPSLTDDRSAVVEIGAIHGRRA